jgi:hypothetical protein
MHASRASTAKHGKSRSPIRAGNERLNRRGKPLRDPKALVLSEIEILRHLNSNMIRIKLPGRCRIINKIAINLRG